MYVGTIKEWKHSLRADAPDDPVANVKPKEFAKLVKAHIASIGGIHFDQATRGGKPVKACFRKVVVTRGCVHQSRVLVGEII